MSNRTELRRRIKLLRTLPGYAELQVRDRPQPDAVAVAYKLAIEKRGNDKCRRKGHTLTIDNIRPSALINRNRLECVKCKHEQQISYMKEQKRNK